MNFDSDSGGDYSLEDGELDNDDIYYNQIKPILLLLWRGGIRDLAAYKRRQRFFYKLGELFMLRYFWKKSDVLVNLEHAMGGDESIAQNTVGENIDDFYNASKHELGDYIDHFLSHA